MCRRSLGCPGRKPWARPPGSSRGCRSRSSSARSHRPAGPCGTRSCRSWPSRTRCWCRTFRPCHRSSPTSTMGRSGPAASTTSRAAASEVRTPCSAHWLRLAHPSPVHAVVEQPAQRPEHQQGCKPNGGRGGQYGGRQRPDQQQHADPDHQRGYVPGGRVGQGVAQDPRDRGPRDQGAAGDGQGVRALAPAEPTDRDERAEPDAAPWAPPSAFMNR